MSKTKDDFTISAFTTKLFDLATIYRVGSRYKADPGSDLNFAKQLHSVGSLALKSGGTLTDAQLSSLRLSNSEHVRIAELRWSCLGPEVTL